MRIKAQGENNMELLKGAAVSAAMKENMVQELHALGSIIPRLAIVRVGEKEDDISYERGAKKKMESIGICCSCFTYSESISNEEFLNEFKNINENENIDGILLLRPLPKHLDERAVEKMINPNKDVDGISPVNMAKLFAGDNSGFAPCTAQAVVEMLDFIDLPLAGKRVTIVGRSLVVGKPLALLLMKKDCTVTVCHTKTVDIPKTCQNAEIVVAAAGRAKMIDERFIAKGSIVIDVGINVDEDGRLCGDVDLASISNAAIATPVPGGVGTVTTSVLASHVIKAAKIRRK